MKEMPGMIRPELQALPQIKDRMTFVYLEHCQLSRDESAITIKDMQGIVHVPVASISVLLLGPGTSLSHRAMELIGDAGVTVIWVGEHGVRYYAGGRPLTHSSKMLQYQAEKACNQKKHIAVVRKMYEMRFPGEDVSKLTLQQLRGREGARMRAAYRDAAKQWGVNWNGREYKIDDFESGNSVNQALTVGNMCLYGLAHAVIFALGCSPGLGFVHVGHENSFVYDIADLYKAEIIIPQAFEIASEQHDDVSAIMRRRIRDAMIKARILERMVRDIRYLIDEDCEEANSADVVYLWDNTRGTVNNATSYGKDTGEEE